MGAGTLVYSGGLVGTQPVHISQGSATATMAGIPQVPLIKAATWKASSATTATFSMLYDCNAIVRLLDTGESGNDAGGVVTLTNGTHTTDMGLNASTSTTSSRVLESDFLVDLDAGVGAITLNNNVGNGGLVSMEIVGYVLNSRTIDHIADASNITAKHHTADLTNPETGFAAFGTEFDSTQYDNTGDYDDANSSTLGQYVVAKIEGITSAYEKIYPLMKAYCSVTSTGSIKQVRNEFYIWNFTTEAWVGAGGNTFNTIITTQYFGDVQYFPHGKLLDYGSDYVEGGVSYIKGWVSSDTDANSYWGYIGLKQVNLIGNNE